MSAALSRPSTFSEVEGLSFPKTILKNSVLSQPYKLYIFTGADGTGKTTLARIFAKAWRCSFRLESGEPCNACPVCRSDVHEYWLPLVSLAVFRSYVGSGSRSDVFILHVFKHLPDDFYSFLVDFVDSENPAPIIVVIVHESSHVAYTLLQKSIHLEFTAVVTEEAEQFCVRALKVLGCPAELMSRVVRLVAKRSFGNIGRIKNTLEYLKFLSFDLTKLDAKFIIELSGLCYMLLGEGLKKDRAELLDSLERNFGSFPTSAVYRTMQEVAFKALEFSAGRKELMHGQELEYCEALAAVHKESLHSVCDFVCHLTPSDNFYTFVSDVFSLKFALEGINPYLADKTVRIVKSSSKMDFHSELDRIRFLGRRQNMDVSSEEPDVLMDDILNQLAK